MERIRLSVRGVTEQVLRCGDIDSRYVDSSVMQSGSKAHRKIQNSMGPDYQKEVSLHMDAEAGGVDITLYGRADGVIVEDGSVTIDEIKTTTLPLDILYEQRELHLGQAKCYARMLLEALDKPPEQITLQLTYYQLDTEELKRHRFDYTAGEIRAFFDDLMERYSVWLRFERDWLHTRDESILNAGFPFPAYRKGQRELAVAAYRTIERRKKLYAQAPTGIGKTLSALFPSIKAMREGIAGKLFYLTAKTVTRAVAEDAVRLMARGGLRLKSITLRAKDKICFCDETICTPDSCPFALGHYDRVNDAILDILNHRDLITPDVIEEYARNHRVCPYETALDVALWCDLVICDYNHVFDPVVYLKRFFGDDTAAKHYVFLIDEAHNLVDRVRDMYSEALRKSDFLHLKRELKGKSSHTGRLKRAAERINRYLLERRKGLGDQKHAVDEGLDEELFSLVVRFNAAAEEWLAAEQHSAHPLQKEVLELYFGSLAFAGIAELYDERYAAITEVNGSDVAFTLFCLDPSKIIAKRLELARASILFSATLTPLPYYREILGGGDEDGIISLPSPFDPDKLLLMAHCGISTKYADRPESIAPIADAIHRAVSSRKGNYLTFFPSYAYMRDVYAAFAERFPQVDTIEQRGSMSEEERAEFLARFDADNPETLVGFCVLGGIFSEGIDLGGDRLIGAVIIGVGLPMINLRQDLIRDYYNGRNGAGFDYAYVFPGMNKVLQAAGRVIRTEEDTGLVLLIDSRFATAKYRALFPQHWFGMKRLYSGEELARLAACWGSAPDPASFS